MAAIRVPKAAELVAAKIRRQIVSGELAEGAMLPPESELVARYGVSRPTLRETFRILESERLVVVRRGVRGGAQVHSPSIAVATRAAQVLLQFQGTTLHDVHEARILLEPPAAAILAERRDPEDLARLTEALEEEARALDDPDQLRRTGGRFHETVLELAGNRTLLVLSAMVQQIIDLHTARFQTMQASGRVTRRRGVEGHADHQRLVELVRAGAAAEAERFWREHLERVSGWLLADVDAKTVLELAR